MSKNIKNEMMLNYTKNILARVADEPTVRVDTSIDYKRVAGVMVVSVLVGGAIVTIPTGATTALATSITGGITFIAGSIKSYGVKLKSVKIPHELITAVFQLFNIIQDKYLTPLFECQEPLSVKEIKEKMGVSLNKALYSVYLLLWAGYRTFKGTVDTYVTKTKMELLKMRGGVC